jgi:uncharacterized protein (TIGR00369 family)
MISDSDPYREGARVSDDWAVANAVPDSRHSEGPLLSESEQQERRDWFRRHLQDGVRFNEFCRLTITYWERDRVEFYMPYADELSAHKGVFHGGVICALIDTCGSGAVMAGHDFNKGSRLTTVSLAVQYLSVAPGEDIRAVGRCSKRGRTLHFADVEVYGASSGKRLASGQVTANIAGERHGVPGVTFDGEVLLG